MSEYRQLGLTHFCMPYELYVMDRTEPRKDKMRVPPGKHHNLWKALRLPKPSRPFGFVLEDNLPLHIDFWRKTIRDRT